MPHTRTIFDEPHPQSLELLAVQALLKNDTATAFKLADRRCRILPLPDPHSYILRAEARHRRGDTSNAVADIAKALEIAPDDIAANRRMLAWADRDGQIEAAQVIVARERNLTALRQAIGLLRQNGQRSFAQLVVFEEAFEGWAIWEGDASLDITLTDGPVKITVAFQPDCQHPLAEFGNATHFHLPRTKLKHAQTVLFATAGSVFHSARTLGDPRTVSNRDLQLQSSPSPSRQVTVIVPVYDDYDATRACIETLREELNDCRVILVNDATPDKRLGDYLNDVATDNRIELIVNTHNVGFVGSVNTALARITCGDVLLLNSDTIVPKGLIKRLTAAARLSPDIGTVTPLSNNGEFVSFPLANQNNPWGSRSEVEKIDGIAARVNSGQIVDLPTGIGFCLFVTRACLERIGALSEDYARGYLEDADFCLRARDHAFRNVCATSVYVGHAGSRSFGHGKRSLVVRNLRILERRFPKYRAECAAFMAADPLCAARQAIEREAFDIQGCRTLLVVGLGVLNATARQRADELGAAQRPALILVVDYRTNGGIVVCKNAAGGVPQSLQFDLSSFGDRESLLRFLKAIKPSCVEFLDPANTPFRLVDVLRRLDAPYRLYIADAGLLGRHNERTFAKAGNRNGAQGKAFVVNASGRSLWVKRWREITKGADRIVVPCPQAEAFASSILPREMRDKLDHTYKKCQPLERKLGQTTQYHLGLVPVRSCAHEQRLMAETARQLDKLRPNLLITVVGSTFDDLGLMRSSGAFVTGTVEANEFKRLVKDLSIKNLFISSTRAIFSHPILSAAAASSLPIAYFDWSEGRVEPNPGDLAIDPGASLHDVVRSLDQWLSKP